MICLSLTQLEEAFFTNFHHIGSLHNLLLNLLRVWQYFSKDKSTKLYMGG